MWCVASQIGQRTSDFFELEGSNVSLWATYLLDIWSIEAEYIFPETDKAHT